MRTEDLDQPQDDLPDLDHAGVDWQDLTHAIRERLWMVILCLVLAAIAATMYLRSQHQEYQARSVLFIEQGENKGALGSKVEGVGSDAIVSLDMINTVVDLLRSFPFAERVAGRLKLQQDPRFLAGLAEKPTTELTASDAGAALRGAVHAEYRIKTRLIDIFVTLPDPTLATEVANTYADEYIRYGFERKAESNKSANQYLIEESERLRHDLKVSEEAMQSFRERNGAASLPEMQTSTQTQDQRVGQEPHRHREQEPATRRRPEGRRRASQRHRVAPGPAQRGVLSQGAGTQPADRRRGPPVHAAQAALPREASRLHLRPDPARLAHPGPQPGAPGRGRPAQEPAPATARPARGSQAIARQPADAAPFHHGQDRRVQRTRTHRDHQQDHARLGQQPHRAGRPDQRPDGIARDGAGACGRGGGGAGERGQGVRPGAEPGAARRVGPGVGVAFHGSLGQDD